MTIAYSGDNITFPDNSVQNTAATGFGFKNRIINGNMVVNQRNTTITASGYSVDRWTISNTANSVISTLQNTTAPTGFINSLKTTITTAQTAGTGNCSVIQVIEGLNIADLAWGSASAATVTLSFWVQCSSTGTFGGSLRNSGSTRSYPFSYTISAANTWEQKTITIAGDTSGTWLTTNGLGIELRFSLFAATSAQQAAGTWYAGSATGTTGQTQLASTVDSTFYITGVQLEKGSTATSFDYRPYGTELGLCQRYYYRIFPAAVSRIMLSAGSFFTSSQASISGNFPVSMRVSPAALEQSGTANHYQIVQAGFGGASCTSVPVFSGATADTFIVTGTSTGAAFTSGLPVSMQTDATNGTNAFLGWSAEL